MNLLELLQQEEDSEGIWGDLPRASPLRSGRAGLRCEGTRLTPAAQPLFCLLFSPLFAEGGATPECSLPCWACLWQQQSEFARYGDWTFVFRILYFSHRCQHLLLPTVKSWPVLQLETLSPVSTGPFSRVRLSLVPCMWCWPHVCPLLSSVRGLCPRFPLLGCLFPAELIVHSGCEPFLNIGG